MNDDGTRPVMRDRKPPMPILTSARSPARSGATSAPTCRVLMVTGAYFPEISSGGLQCQRMTRALVGRAQVEVLTTAVDRALASREAIDGVPVMRLFVNVASTVSKLKASA